MSLKKAKGIILNRKIVNEKDAIIEVLSEEENFYYRFHKFWIPGILKSRTRNPITFEIGNLVSLNYYDKPHSEILNIKEFFLIERFSEIKKSYENLELLSKILKITYYGCFSDSDIKEIYKLLIYALYYLEEFYKKPDNEILEILKKLNVTLNDSLLAFYLLRILKTMGFIGDLETCPSCKNPFQKKAKWQDGFYFYCHRCDLIANSDDFFYKNIIELAIKNKYKIFISKLWELVEMFKISDNLIEISKIDNFFEQIEIYSKMILPIQEQLFFIRFS